MQGFAFVHTQTKVEERMGRGEKVVTAPNLSYGYASSNKWWTGFSHTGATGTLTANILKSGLRALRCDQSPSEREPRK